MSTRGTSSNDESTDSTIGRGRGNDSYDSDSSTSNSRDGGTSDERGRTTSIPSSYTDSEEETNPESTTTTQEDIGQRASEPNQSDIPGHPPNGATLHTDDGLRGLFDDRNVFEPDSTPDEQEGTSVTHTKGIKLNHCPTSVASYIDHLAHGSHRSIEGRRLLTAIPTQHQNRHLHVSFYRCGNREEFESIVRILGNHRVRDRSTPRRYREDRFIAAAYHNESTNPHIHLLHSCAWNNYQCKCSMLKQLVQFRLSGGYTRSFESLSDEDWYRITIYHLAAPKQQLVCQVGQKSWRISFKDRDLQMGRDQGHSEPGVVETRSVPKRRLRQQGGRTRDAGIREGQTASELVGGHGQRSSTTSGGGDVHGLPTDYDSTFEKLFQPSRPVRASPTVAMVTLFKRTPHCPIESIFYSSDFLDDPAVCDINIQGNAADVALRTYKLYINQLKLRDLWQMQTSPGFMPAYEAASSKELGEYYHSFDDSIFMLLELLLFQFDLDIENVFSFLKSCADLLDKNLGKINTILIWGPASSGKNFFVDALTAFMLNFGKIENPSRLNTFAFMHGHNRRVIKWDEACLDPYFCDTVLNLMQGKSFLANIKFKAPMMIFKTPLFVMSNVSPFPNEERFLQRHLAFRWQYCPYLVKYKHKQPYPLAAGALVCWAARVDDVDFMKMKNKVIEIRQTMLNYK